MQSFISVSSSCLNEGKVKLQDLCELPFLSIPQSLFTIWQCIQAHGLKGKAIPSKTVSDSMPKLMGMFTLGSLGRFLSTHFDTLRLDLSHFKFFTLHYMLA